MIAADTSTWIAFFEGDSGPDVEILAQGLKDKQVVMAPAVLAELLSDPKLGRDRAALLADVPRIELTEGHWERAGYLRAKVLAKKRRARLGDSLIAQSCLDRGSALGYSRPGFLAFSEAAGNEFLVPGD